MLGVGLGVKVEVLEVVYDAVYLLLIRLDLRFGIG